jgi:segregation and condensation protein B
MMHEEYRESAVEALILASPEPLPGRKICQFIEDLTPAQVAEAVASVNTRYAANGSSFRIREIAGGYQFYILPEYVGFVEDMFSRRRKLRLTRPALETVAIIAYRQPCTKTDIEHIRGVASDGVIKTLLEKNIITVMGRAEGVGKPLQYGTTSEFLKFFGLNSLNDLPRMTEIEQLISASDPMDRLQLRLNVEEPGEAPKLNVADGTFTPDADSEAEDGGKSLQEKDVRSETVDIVETTTDEFDNMATDTEYVESPEVAEPVLVGASVGTGFEERLAPATKVVLKKGSESTILPPESGTEDEEAGCAVDSDTVGN